MSLSESIDPHSPKRPLEPPPIQTRMTPEPSLPPFVEEFHTFLQQYMDIEDHSPINTRFGSGTSFRGQLHGDADEVYVKLAALARPEHYTVYMQRSEKRDEVVLVDGVLVARNITAAWWVHLGLLILTLVTTTLAGSLLGGYDFTTLRSVIENLGVATLKFVITTVLDPLLPRVDFSMNWSMATLSDRLRLLEIYREGRRFAFPLLLILGVHEMGHYVAARLHGVKVTLPFFVPLPIFGTLGTLGAVIFIKDTFRNRKILFDVGIAGPLAGLVVAIVVFAWGLHQPVSGGFPVEWLKVGINRVSVPPLLDFVASATSDIKNTDNLDRNIFYRHPEALAGWFGIILTSLNLLPLGQFDGGHIAFALFGRRFAWPLAIFTAVTLAFMGLSGAWIGWLIWPVMALLTGLIHPPPHNDITPLGWPRTIIGIVTFILFFMMIIVTPFYNAQL